MARETIQINHHTPRTAWYAVLGSWKTTEVESRSACLYIATHTYMNTNFFTFKLSHAGHIISIAGVKLYTTVVCKNFSSGKSDRADGMQERCGTCNITSIKKHQIRYPNSTSL